MEKFLQIFKIQTVAVLLLTLFFATNSFGQTQTYNTQGTYTFTVPAGVTSITVSAWGAGGAGGGVVGNNDSPRGGGGGEAGSFVRGTMTVSPGAVYTVVVGAGGSGSTASGTAGSASSFGGSGVFNAIGGAGGAGATNLSRLGAGGNTANVGNIVSGTSTVSYYGGNGGTATASGAPSFSGGGGGSAGAGGNGGNGGATAGGTAGAAGGVVGATGRGSGDDGVGNIGGNPGAGGSGARNANNNTTYVGGNGGDGRITVTWTCSGPNVSNFTTTASAACTGNSSTITITSTSIISSGNYNVYYNLTGANITASPQSATLSFNTTTNIGTFSTIAMANPGATTITIVSVDCMLLANGNTANIAINPNPTAVTATPSITSVCYDGSVGLTSSATSNSNTATTLLNQNFNGTPTGWTTTNTSTGGTSPVSAAWTLTPNDYLGIRSNDTSQFYMSNSDAQGSGGTTNTTLQSPAFSTMGISAATLSFWHYYRFYSGSSAVVEVSTNGSTWTALQSYTANEGTATGFVNRTFNLSGYLNQPTVYVRFRYTASWGYYWAIDNVLVSSTPSTPSATYAWTSTPAGFTSAVQNPTATNQTVDRTYTVTVTNNYGCTASATTTTIAIAPNTWVGTTSSTWDVATNWSCGVVPNANHNVSIPINTPNATNLNVDYTLPSGKTLTMSGTGALTIAPQSVLTIAGSANFGNRPVTVKSDATGDGMIGQVSGSLTNATNVTVERYIPSGKRAFRFLTPGVTTTDYISNNWQLATHITGSTTGANGFDATTTGGPSMYTYNNSVASGTGWTAIPSTNATNLEAGLGYRLLIRGDRTPTLITSASVPNMNTAITLSAKGTVKTGTVVVNASSTPAINGTSNTTTNGFSLVGNPYVSAVDWNAVSRSGLTDVYYAWDPNMGTAAQRGRYVTYSASTGFNNLGNSGSSNVGRYIQSGQAFFVKNTTLGTAGTLTFNESNKVGNFASVFRNQQDMSISKLGLLVYEPNELALGSLPIDGAVALFGTDFTNAIEAGDVEKLESAGENLAIFSSNQKLAMSAMAPVVEDDELLLKTLRFAANKSYTFKIEPANFDATVAAYFVDQFLNTETAIDLTQDSFVTVTTTSDVLSFGEDRFKIVFGTQQLGNPDFDKVVSLYPNPSKLNEFNLNLPNWDDTVQVNMFNSLGQQIPVSIENGDGMSKRFRVNTNLSSGVYYIKVTQNGKETTKKWIYNN